MNLNLKSRKMKTNVTTTLTFSEEDVKKIVLEHIKTLGYKPAGMIVINVGDRLVGYGTNGRPETYFQNITADVEKVEEEQEEDKLSFT